MIHTSLISALKCGVCDELINAGGTSASDTAVLVLATGNGVRDFVPAVLWNHGKLDCVSDQCALRGVSDQEGAGEG